MIHVRRGDVNMFCESREQADLFLAAGYTEVKDNPEAEDEGENFEAALEAEDEKTEAAPEAEDEKTEAAPEKKKKTK